MWLTPPLFTKKQKSKNEYFIELMHSFIQQIFIEYSIYTLQCYIIWGYGSMENRC